MHKNQLPSTFPGVSRRTFLRLGAYSAAALTAGSLPAIAASIVPANLPFSLGVASGEPTHHSVVLWTRLAFDPLNGGGMPPVPIEVQWKVATDSRLRHVVRQGKVWAMPEDGHSVHVQVEGLGEDRWYWYQFKVGSSVSPLGRTRTFPEPASRPRELRFAFVSCQHFESGFFTAWQHLAQEDVDFVIHLGDYIYEDGSSAGGVRQHAPATEIFSLDDYRNRHAQYKTDAYLQAAHAQFPFIVTWDDHEVENNYAGAVSENDDDTNPANDVSTGDFLARRAHAYKAYFEHMPLDPELEPKGSSLRLFRRFNWGRLAEFNVLDTRQYRTNQPCGGARDLFAPVGDDIVIVNKVLNGGIACGEEPNSTLMGFGQERWLTEGLKRSRSRWNVVAQQIMMTAVDFGPGLARFDPRLAGLQVRNVDAWDGYVAARNRLLGFVDEEDIRNLVVLSGDIHSNWVADLKADFAIANAPVVATEFVGTSITSDFPPSFIPIIQGALLDPTNAHVRFFDGALHGYVRCVITPEQWRSDYRVVDTILQPSAQVRTLKSFVVQNDRLGALAV